mgnify:CR=1 FL=1
MSGLRETCAEFIAARASQAESGNDLGAWVRDDCHVIAYMEQTRTGLAMGRLLGTPMSVPHERVVRAIAVALDDERRQTQRQMIAALYWRAGATMVLAERAEKAGNGPRAERLINDGAGTWNAARAMEAACPR